MQLHQQKGMISLSPPTICNSAEMIMPVKAFEEFCAHHQVQHLSTDDFAKIEYDRMKWRFGQAGIRE
ncbi:phenol hydroxylase subunit [Salmonella enterica subsp. enterica serovar Corvallis]